jgi:hypothetical protein
MEELMDALAARPSTLSEIRDVLAAEAGRDAPAPWAGSSAALDGLYALLRRRRGDDALWGRLEDLAARLDRRRFDPSASERGELLGERTQARLMAALRRDLADAPASGWRGWLARGAGASALTAFLILGGAVGCQNDCDDLGDDTTCDAAVDQGLTGEEARDLCNLVEVVEAADVSSGLRDEILRCLPWLDRAYRAELLDSFCGLSDADLADRLESLIEPDGACFEDAH